MIAYKETSIVWRDGKPMASIWSASKWFKRRMDALGFEGKTYQGGILYDVPKEIIKIEIPWQLADKQRAELKERLNKSKMVSTMA